MTVIQDPDVIQDIYTGRDRHLIDKNELLNEMFAPVFPDVFMLMPADETWKAHRKAMSHMFFKDKLQNMANVFKEHLNAACD